MSFRPIFIVGPERSGTTLLAVTLGRHSHVAATPESHFLADFGELPEVPENRDLLLDRVLRSPRIRDMGLDVEAVRRRFEDQPCELRALFQTLLEQYAAQQGKPQVAEKTPYHVFHAPRILDWYSGARIVCIVRDGRDVVLSLQRAPWAPKDIPTLARRWNEAVESALRFEEQFSDRFLRIAFEDLLREPRRVLSRVTGFLGLEFEEALLNPGVPAAGQVVPGWERGWKEKATTEFDAQRILAWKRTADVRQIWLMNTMMGPQLASLGYPDTDLRDCPWRWRMLCRGIRAGSSLLDSRFGALVSPGIQKALKPLATKLDVMRDVK